MDAKNLEESMNADQALFEGQVQGLVALFHTDERPLTGLAGLLDWRFQGAISKFLKEGFLTGQAGECAYLPLSRAGRTYHLILAGAGATRNKEALPAETLKALKKNLTALKIERVGVSREDLGSVNLKGLPVCALR